MTGRINELLPRRSEAFNQQPNFAPVTGVSDATTSYTDALTLSPDRKVVLRNFTVRLTDHSSVFQNDRVVFYLAINPDSANGHSDVLCTIPQGAFACSMRDDESITIPAPSTIALEVHTGNFSSGYTSTADALFGYRLTTT